MNSFELSDMKCLNQFKMKSKLQNSHNNNSNNSNDNNGNINYDEKVNIDPTNNNDVNDNNDNNDNKFINCTSLMNDNITHYNEFIEYLQEMEISLRSHFRDMKEALNEFLIQIENLYDNNEKWLTKNNLRNIDTSKNMANIYRQSQRVCL